MPRSIGPVIHQRSSSYRRIVGASPTGYVDADPVDPVDPGGPTDGQLMFETFDSGAFTTGFDSGFTWDGDTGNVVVSSDQAQSGSHSLRLGFPAGENAHAEQRFTIGFPRQDIWTRFWIRVPINWEHGTAGSINNATNNKLFALWMDEYETTGPTGVIQIRNDGNGNSKLRPYLRDRNNVHSGEFETNFIFARSPQDQGRWMEVAVRARMGMTTAERDINGLWEMWRRWEGNTGWELCFSLSDWDNEHVGGNEGFNHGHLMGPMRANQPESTMWFIDGFYLSTESPIDFIDDGGDGTTDGFFALEDFESGTLNSPPAGLSWTNSWSTSVQFSEALGSQALRYFYQGNLDPAEDAMAEQTFVVDNEMPEMWVRYSLHVPSNYHHRPVSPSNNKIMSIFMDAYEGQGEGPTAFWGTWADGNGGSLIAITHAVGGNTGGVAYSDYEQFIRYPDDIGRTMHMCYRVVMASARGANDGIMQMWRRWDGETTWTLMHDKHDADIAPGDSAVQGWKQCKVLGWSNSGFDEDTIFFIDNFAVAENSLIDSATPAPPPSSTVVDFQLPAENFEPQKIPLEIINPRPDAERSSDSRYSFAYPGLQYEVPIIVLGGAYPFKYEIVARSGTASNINNASIGIVRAYNVGREWYQSTNARDYGLLRYTPGVNDDGNTYVFSVRVTGQDGVAQTRTFSGTVSANKFVFVVPSVASSGNGSFNSPYKFASDLWASSSDDTNQGKFVYFREGDVGAFTSSFLQPIFPKVYMRFPGDQRPVFDGTVADYLFANNGMDDWFWSGIDVQGTPGTSLSNVRFFESGTSTNDLDRAVWHDSRFFDGRVGSAGTDNNGWIVYMNSGNTKRYTGIVGCVFDGANASSNGFSAYTFFDALDYVVEHNTVRGFTGPEVFNAKDGNRRMSVRANDMWNVGTPGNPVRVYNQDASAVSEQQEICWNFIRSDQRSIGVRPLVGFWVYRNTGYATGFKYLLDFSSQSSGQESLYIAGNALVAGSNPHLIRDGSTPIDSDGSTDAEAEAYMVNSTFDNAFASTVTGFLDPLTGKLTGSGQFNYSGKYGAEIISAGILAHDTFESGDLTYTAPVGFQWTTSTGTEVISNSAYSKSGNHILRFDYPSGANGFREQRFAVGDALPEVWFKYWLRVPDNWEHGSVGTVSSNNFIFAVWVDGYSTGSGDTGSGATGTVFISNYNGSSRIGYRLTRDDKSQTAYINGDLIFATPSDSGRWMEVVVRAKRASSSSLSDGRLEMWRRWEDDENWTQAFSVTDWDNYHSTIGGFQNGYLMGWFDANQPSAHNWYVDDFTVASASLLSDATIVISEPLPEPEPEPTDPPPSGAAILAYDDFESGNLSYTTPEGFDWTSSWGTDVITDHPKSGAFSLRFDYPSGANGMREQRFTIGGAHPDIWFKYWIRTPNNWEHGTDNTNNKWFAIWMDDYEREGPTGVIQYRRVNDGDSRLSPYMRTRNNVHPGEENPGFILVRSPEDSNRWMEVVIHVKMADSASNANGRFEMWRRWEGNTDWEDCFSYVNWDNYHVGGNQGWAYGYLMGWCNATQPAPHTWYLDDFTVATESLLTGLPTDSLWPSNVLDIVDFEDGQGASANGVFDFNGGINVVTEDAVSGTHSVRLRHGARADGDDSSNEERFNLNGNAYPELWIGYWMRVPTNFYHRTQSGSANNKLLAVWMDGYSNNGDGPTVIWEYWPNSNGSSQLAYHWAPSGRNSTANGHRGHFNWIGPSDQGRWIQMAHRMVASSSSSASDGIIQLYTRWQGDSSWTLQHNDQNVDEFHVLSSGPQGWADGYLHGWSNSGFDETTDFLLDDIVISTSSIITE